MYIAGTNRKDVVEFLTQHNVHPFPKANAKYTYYLLTTELIMLTDSFYDLISQ